MKATLTHSPQVVGDLFSRPSHLGRFMLRLPASPKRGDHRPRQLDCWVKAIDPLR